MIFLSAHETGEQACPQNWQIETPPPSLNFARCAAMRCAARFSRRLSFVPINRSNRQPRDETPGTPQAASLRVSSLTSAAAVSGIWCHVVNLVPLAQRLAPARQHCSWRRRPRTKQGPLERCRASKKRMPTSSWRGNCSGKSRSVSDMACCLEENSNRTLGPEIRAQPHVSPSAHCHTRTPDWQAPSTPDKHTYVSS